MKLAGFMHIGLLGIWKEVNEEILTQIRDSGLLDELEVLQLCVLGTDEFELPFEHPKIEIAHRSGNLREFEYPTIELVQKYCLENPDAKVVHLHNSGVTRPDTDPKYPWYRYFEVVGTIHDWRQNVILLDECDAVGIELMARPAPHFAGTWWWANADYINTLPSTYEARRFTPEGVGAGGPDQNMHGAEFWIGMNPNARLCSLFKTGVEWVNRLDSVPLIKAYLSTRDNQYWL